MQHRIAILSVFDFLVEFVGLSLKSLTMAGVSSPISSKRRRLIGNIHHTVAQEAKRNPTEEGADGFYEFTAEDYYRLWKTKKEDKFLKTQKMREGEQAKCRSRFTKAVIRVRFPDNHTLEATFHPSDKIQSLVDHLKKVAAGPELPFYLFTAPPKEVIRDMSMDFYSAGFVPGANVHLSYGIPN